MRCRTASSNAEAVVLATSLLLLQVWRRLYECAFVSVHSDSSAINLIHYASGFAHYFCACVGVLLEAPCFTSAYADDDDADGGSSVGGHGAFRWVHVSLDPKSVTLTQCVSAVLFLWAWHHQRKAHQILARIRLVISFFLSHGENHGAGCHQAPKPISVQSNRATPSLDRELK